MPGTALTNLGIRQVPRELIEVADAFGSTPQALQVRLVSRSPPSWPGCQCIMLALSMTVIASMIGAGLGYQVLVGIQRVDIGMGFEAGLPSSSSRSSSTGSPRTFCRDTGNSDPCRPLPGGHTRCPPRIRRSSRTPATADRRPAGDRRRSPAA